MPPVLPTPDARLVSEFERFLKRPPYPCVGAKSALAKGQIEYMTGRDIRSGWNDLPIIKGLQRFAAGYRQSPRMFQSFVVIFEGPLSMKEDAFETALWARAQSLHDKDVWMGSRYDARVSPDPGDDDFGLSFGGEAFFIVGLHPRASRKARRFRRPALVFNLHDQFERLRASGKYEGMRSKILQRDRNWSGSINPMLAVHGTVSEARQYSGRAVGEDWSCPFQPRIGARR